VNGRAAAVLPAGTTRSRAYGKIAGVILVFLANWGRQAAILRVPSRYAGDCRLIA